LDHIADFLKFISSAQSFWFSLNTSYNHGCHLASCFRLDPDKYKALLIVAGLASYTRFGFQIKADALCPTAVLGAAATAADAAMQRDGGIAVAAARRLRRWQQRDSMTSAAAAPSANAPTHTPSNATNAPTYASSSLVKDGGTTALTASSLSAATASPAAMSTPVADAPPPPTTAPTATPMTSFVELNLIYYYYLFIYH
jgi:hypothetical protein